jgi:hypothetical protein
MRILKEIYAWWTRKWCIDRIGERSFQKENQFSKTVLGRSIFKTNLFGSHIQVNILWELMTLTRWAWMSFRKTFIASRTKKKRRILQDQL